MDQGDGESVILVAYDPRWPATFTAVAAEVRACLRSTAADVIHVGSTAVPGLTAKPVIDIVVLVNDSADEAAYLAPLLGRGFRLSVREPGWFEHRLLQRRDPPVNLHVFSAGCDEVGRMLLFRDWLRGHPNDRDLYAATKRRLAQQSWDRVQDYADAKADVVAEIMARAQQASSETTG
jgi:GrpB-like predicted nucleotidyltransferase (UPF0157 family)